MQYTTEIVKLDLYDKSDEPINLIAKRMEAAANASEARRLVTAVGDYSDGRLSRLLLIWEATAERSES